MRNRMSLPPTKEEVNAFARVCLSVCLSVSKITKQEIRSIELGVCPMQLFHF